MPKKPYAKITPESFATVKFLLKNRSNDQKIIDIAKLMGCSDVTIWRISKAEKYEDYKKAMTNEKANKPEKESEEKPQKTPQIAKPIFQTTTYQTNRIIELLTNQNELLRGISNKLAFIVEELTD